MALSLERRLALLEQARRSQSWIIEDDYDSEFHYDGQPMPAMQGLDRHGTVLYVGTFSKALFPSLRLAYLIVPPRWWQRSPPHVRYMTAIALSWHRPSRQSLFCKGILLPTSVICANSIAAAVIGY